MEHRHCPVLLDEVMTYLAPREGERFIDGTVGFGGHAERILKSNPACRLFGIDRDDAALAASRDRLGSFGDRVQLVRGCYAQMGDLAEELGWNSVDGVLLDIGVSSVQLDEPTRGFSHRFDGPLDMRMDRRSRESAATLLNTYSEDDLTVLFRDYGEERMARRIARAVVARREERPWERTLEFAEMIEKMAGPKHHRIHPATRCFQALRIAVNDELEQLRQGLRAAVELLHPGGRLVVITFHSLEDRIVKVFIKDEAATCVCPPRFPICTCGKTATLKALTKKPVRPSEDELRENRRASSAKLRAAVRL